MCPIQSLICFNGGSAGDFLAGICSEQILGKSTYKIHTNGMAGFSGTFKTETIKNYYSNHAGVLQICDHTKTVLTNFSNVLPVENTHYFLDFYPTIANQLFYIDYPDAIVGNIVETYLAKRFQYDRQLLADTICQQYREPLKSKINKDNIINVCKINWIKNVKSWRNNSLLEPLYLSDYFDRTKFYNMIEKICQQKITNFEKLSENYDNWISKNTQLRQLFL